MPPPADGPDWQSATDISVVPLGTVSIPANAVTGQIQVSGDQQTIGLGLQLRSVAQIPTVSVQGGVSGLFYSRQPVRHVAGRGERGRHRVG